MNRYDDLVRRSVRTLEPYQPGKPIEEVRRELGLEHVVKLASNEYPEGPFPEVQSALADELERVHRYPDASWHGLRSAVSKALGLPPEELFFGNGTNELLELLIHLLCEPGHEVVFGRPSFAIYGLLCQSHFDCGVAVPLDADHVHDLDAMAAAVTERTRLLLVCNPNNPTGTYVGEEAVVRLLERLPAHVMLVMDEAYAEFAVAEDFPDALRLRRRYPQLVCLRTFSKVYSLAGLRIGYLVGPPDLVELLQRVRQPFNVNSLSQRAAAVAITQQHRVRERRESNRQRMAFLVAGLQALGCEVVPSQANFVLTFAPRAPADLFERLLAEGVIVRPMGSFGLGPSAFRVTVGLEEENRLFLSALAKVLPGRRGT